jgi:hypothetical protein
MEREAIVLRHKGATSLPAFGVGQRLVCGEERLAEAVAAAGGRAPQPLAFWAR